MDAGPDRHMLSGEAGPGQHIVRPRGLHSLGRKAGRAEESGHSACGHQRESWVGKVLVRIVHAGQARLTALIIKMSCVTQLQPKLLREL